MLGVSRGASVASRTCATETPGAVAGAAALGSGTGDEDDDDGEDGSSTARTPEGSGGADEVAPDVTWGSTALEYRGSDGLLVAYGARNGDLPDRSAHLSLLHITSVESLKSRMPRARRRHRR